MTETNQILQTWPPPDDQTLRCPFAAFDATRNPRTGAPVAGADA